MNRLEELIACKLTENNFDHEILFGGKKMNAVLPGSISDMFFTLGATLIANPDRTDIGTSNTMSLMIIGIYIIGGMSKLVESRIDLT